MTPDNEPKTPRIGEAANVQAKRAAKDQAGSTSPDNAELDEDTRPEELTTKNDGGAQG